MVSAYWLSVVEDGLHVPQDRPLPDLTAELTTMLGDPDPRAREEIALATLLTWVSAGVYDDLLTGLGDGMSLRLGVGLESGDPATVHTRSNAALVLAECLDRDTRATLVTDETVLRWGDRIASWWIRERDLRDFVPGEGWAHAVAQGADAIGALARSPKVGAHGLAVLLDVVADRLLLPTERFFVAGEDDRMAAAVMHLLRRDLLSLNDLEPWVTRLAGSAAPAGDYLHHPYLVAGNVQSFLRSLHLQLALAMPQPAVRTDLLLRLIEVLRATNPLLG